MENTLPLITLGIPIYNAADLIERTLLSALNQTYLNVEYILVDDKGNSMDVVRRVVEEHPRRDAVRIIDQGHNLGTGAARNAIVENAMGEYLFTMDCDDVIVPGCVEILYKKNAGASGRFCCCIFCATRFARARLSWRMPLCGYVD